MGRESYIPKDATQQSEFLKKYPEFDGRGINIAVIDSDVADINLPGLQKTSTAQSHLSTCATGLPKIIDCLGKPMLTIDTSTIVETKLGYEKKHIIGLSGRKLKIPKNWKNISDKWHIGSVQCEEFYDITLEANKKHVKHIKCISDNEFESFKNEIIDCIVWFDGEKWRACLDTSFLRKDANLGLVTVLTNYYDSYGFAYFDNTSTYCINICDDGNSLHIMHPHDSHGTQVAQIAGGYFPEKPESNGLALGAQIFSMHLGITPEDFERALLKCIELKIDILNISFGGELSEFIAIEKIIKEMVEEHGIIITYAAGNDGPFYASIPSQDSVISKYVYFIGSIYTEDQIKMKTRMQFTESLNSVNTYSSKGPLPCGSRGIDFVVPGAAILDLPKWYRSNQKEDCEGTSFAAPQVAGSIACLLSALKANNIQYSPTMIKMALAKTAYLPEGANKLEYGNGIIQINDAFEFIKKSNNNLPLKYLSPISIDDPKQKGILFYRSKNKMSEIYRFYVNMDSALDTKWILKCDSESEKFISYSKVDNFFIVTIDSSLLEDGSINYAEIYGYDPLNPWNVPLFYLPITIICPADSLNNKEIILKPGLTTHLFLRCPSEFRRCHITITANDGKEKEITMKYRQKKSRSNEALMKHPLKFAMKQKTRCFSFIGEENVENFEICIYHKHLNDLSFKFDINFRNV